MNAVIPHSVINAIESQRERALNLYGEAFDALVVAGDLAAIATGAGGFSPPFIAFDRHTAFAWKERDEFLVRVRQDIDRGIWNHLLRATQLERLMDSTARDQFRSQLQADPPEATAANCIATLAALIGDSDVIFRRGIATAFSKLDRRFRSHDGFKIGSRVILSNTFSEWGGWNQYRRHDETLRDIERTFLTLDGKEHPEWSKGFLGAVSEAMRQGGLKMSAFVVEDDYFILRAFRNGNAHLWFKRDDLVEKVNQLLAQHYGAALGVSPENATKTHEPKTGLARDLGYFPTPERVRDRLCDIAGVRRAPPSLSILEPSAGDGALSRWLSGMGHRVTCVEIDAGRAQGLKASGLYERVHHADFLAMTPTPFDLVVMNPPFDRGRDIDHVTHALKFLNPGGRLVSVMSAGTEFREDRKTVDFRALVERQGHFHDLPEGSFAPATNVNTLICEIRAPG